jgi:serine/threonine protein phosphatase PrpC
VTRFAWGAATDTGRVRQANEDSLLVVDGLFAVADGMGGHKAGEVASRLAIETLQDAFTAAGTDVLVGAVQEANRALVERSADDAELTGMGTTLCALALVDAEGRDAIAVVNVGDSRLYLLSDGELTQVTEDHSLVATLERQGRITRAEAAVHPQRNILTRALGIDANVMVDSWEILPMVGDRYLICSDGLFNEVDDNRLAATLRRLADPDEAARELVRLANEAGGRDNVTCVIVDVVDDKGRDPSASTTSDRITSHHSAGDAGLLGDGVDDEPDGGGALDGDGEASASPPSRRERRRAARASGERPRRRVLTWRVGLFVLAFLAIVGVTIGAIVYMGRNVYYVGVQDEEVVIFRGRPGGVLWIQPELEESTGIALVEVPAATVDAVEAGVEQSTLDDARRYVENLQDQIDRATTTTTTTSTTTTTIPTLPAAPPVTLTPASG